jgi:hypothetical protein
MGTGFVGLIVRYKLVLMLVIAVILPPASSLAGINGISGAILIGFLVSFLYLQLKIELVIGRDGRRRVISTLLRTTAASVAGVIAGLLSYWIALLAQVSLAVWIAICVALIAYVGIIIKLRLISRTDMVDLLGQPLTSRLLSRLRSRR